MDIDAFAQLVAAVILGGFVLVTLWIVGAVISARASRGAK